MSYHETFEFFAIDRCLTPSAMRALRAISTRATITPTRFYNYYDWGGLKADPADLLRRYFDVFVYTEAAGARWGMLRFPTERIELARWRPFVTVQRRASVGAGCATAVQHEEFTILTLTPPEGSFVDGGEADPHGIDDGEWDERGSAELGNEASWPLPLALARADLLAGDMRALYLLWLCDVQHGDRPTTEREPIRPDSRLPLTGTLGAFAEFLRLDTDLLAVALATPSSPRLRTAGTLLRAAGAYASERRRRAADRAAAARAKRLDTLERKQPSEWIMIDKLVSSSNVRASTYEDVVRRLSALHELSVDRGAIRAFARRLDALLDHHPAKTALRRRLRERGLTRRNDRE